MNGENVDMDSEEEYSEELEEEDYHSGEPSVSENLEEDSASKDVTAETDSLKKVLLPKRDHGRPPWIV